MEGFHPKDCKYKEIQKLRIAANLQRSRDTFMRRVGATQLMTSEGSNLG